MRDSFSSLYGEEEKENELKIRISARLGRTKKYHAQNVGFRCAQFISEDEENFEKNHDFQIFKLRAPIHHHLNERDSHPIHREEL